MFEKPNKRHFFTELVEFGLLRPLERPHYLTVVKKTSFNINVKKSLVSLQVLI